MLNLHSLSFGHLGLPPGIPPWDLCIPACNIESSTSLVLFVHHNWGGGGRGGSTEIRFFLKAVRVMEEDWGGGGLFLRCVSSSAAVIFSFANLGLVDLH